MYCTCNGPPNAGTSWALSLILQYIADLLIGETPWITAEGACEFPAPYKQDSDDESSVAPLPQDYPPHQLSKYVGTYNHPGFGDIEVSIRTSPTEQLFLSMGRFLRAQLFYNSTSDRFYTNLTGVYWYMNDRIPIHFQSSLTGGEIDILKIPMHSPFDSTKPFAFMRGKAEAERLSGPNQSYKFGCTSASRALNTSCLIYILVIIILLSYLR